MKTIVACVVLLSFGSALAQRVKENIKVRTESYEAAAPVQESVQVPVKADSSKKVVKKK